MLSVDPFDPMDSKDSFDQSDHLEPDPLVVIGVVILGLSGVLPCTVHGFCHQSLVARLS